MSEKILCQKYLCKKNCKGRINLGSKIMFCPKWFSVQKKFGVQTNFGNEKFCVEKKLGPKKFWVKKHVGSKKIWVLSEKKTPIRAHILNFKALS